MMTIDAARGEVVAVTVTYGERRDMLLSVIAALRTEGVARVIVVDNGARWPVADDLADRFGDFVDVVVMGGNKGSAAGYVAGFKAAMAGHAPFIWLLDDDNRPREGALAILRGAYAEEMRRTPFRLLAVLALRPEHFAGGVSSRQLLTRWDSFGGFHVVDLVGKLLNRLPFRRRAIGSTRLVLGVAPYGGMLFHRSLVERIGLPRLEFGQYGDDTEFTWRITSRGGRIIQVTDAIIDDLESAFQQNAQFKNRFVGALLGESRFRTYYTFRNIAYFEYNFRKKSNIIFNFNRKVYFLIMKYYSVRLKLPDRYNFIRKSSDEGLARELRPSRDFPLG